MLQVSVNRSVDVCVQWVVTSNIFRSINHATKCYKGSVYVKAYIDEEMLCKCFDKCSEA